MTLQWRASLILLMLSLIAGLFVIGGVVTGSQAQSLRNLPEAKFTGKGPEACLSCHGGPMMTVIAETPHGNMSNPHTPYAQQGCESCHGPGSLHVSSARGGQGFPSLNDFKYVGWPKEGQFDTCLSCHAEDQGDHEGIGWVGSAHDLAGMTCSSCHNVHAKEDPLASVAGQRNQCASCHGLSNSKHAVFEQSGMQLDTMKCTTCHNPHQL